MKKIICTFISFCILLIGSIPVYANAYSSSLFDDIEELKSCEELIVSDLIYKVPDFTNEDIDYERALKTYYKVNLFDLESIDENSANDLLEKSDYFFRIQVDANDKCLEIVLEKVGEVTDEIRERHGNDSDTVKWMEENSGKWIISSERVLEKSDYDKFKKDIVKFVEKSKTKYKKIHEISGLSGNLLAVVMLVTEDSEIQFKIIHGSVNGKVIDYYNPDDNLYSLEELKEIANQFDPSDFELLYGLEPPTQPSNNNTIIIAAACAGVVIIAAAAAVTVICIKKKKAKASAELSE